MKKLFAQLSRLPILYSLLLVLAGGAAWETSIGLAGPSLVRVPSVVVVTPVSTHAQSSARDVQQRGSLPGEPTLGAVSQGVQSPSSQGPSGGSEAPVTISGSSSPPQSTPDSNPSSQSPGKTENQPEVVSPTVVVVETPTSSGDHTGVTPSRDHESTTTTSQGDSSTTSTTSPDSSTGDTSQSQETATTSNSNTSSSR